MRHQAHVPGRRVLREYRQDHRLLQGADGLPLLPAGLDQPRDRQGRGGWPHEPRRRFRERAAHRHRIPRQQGTFLEAVQRAHGGRPPGAAVPHHALQAGHPGQRAHPVPLRRLRPPRRERQRRHAVQERARHRVARLHRPGRGHRRLLRQGLDPRPRLGPAGQGVRAVDRQAHERTVQAVEQGRRLPLLRVLHTGRIPHRPLQPHGPREVRPHRGRHRPRLLHQLLPLPGVAAAHPDGEAQLREGLPVLRVRRLHQLLRVPVPAGQPEGAGGRVGLRLQHRHRLPRHQHADRPLLRVRLPGRLRADRRGLQVPRVRQLRP